MSSDTYEPVNDGSLTDHGMTPAGEITTYVSYLDNVAVVEIDPASVRGPIRVYLGGELLRGIE